MCQRIGTNRSSEASGADLDELREEARKAGILARHRGSPLRSNRVVIPTAASGRIQGASREKKCRYYGKSSARRVCEVALLGAAVRCTMARSTGSFGPLCFEPG